MCFQSPDSSVWKDTSVLVETTHFWPNFVKSQNDMCLSWSRIVQNPLWRSGTKPMKVASYKHHLKKRKKRNPLNRVLLFTAIFFFNLNNTAMPSSGQPFSQEPPQTAQDFQQSHTLFRRLVFVYQSHRIISAILQQWEHFWCFKHLIYFSEGVSSISQERRKRGEKD